MEVRIKNNGELVDATIEMVDGVMVVSPKEKFEPKDGDVLSCFFYGKYQGTFVFEEAGECGEAIFHVVLDADGKFIKGNECSYFGYIYDACSATEEEKKKLFDKLKEKGLAWDAEKRELVKLKWNPVLGEVYFRIEFVDDEFRYADWNWKNSTYEIKAYERGWCFKNEEECKSFCDKLNQAIDSVKL